MEKYIKAQMDVIEFENEDIITSSGCTYDGCGDKTTELPIIPGF